MKLKILIVLNKCNICANFLVDIKIVFFIDKNVKKILKKIINKNTQVLDYKKQ